MNEFNPSALFSLNDTWPVGSFKLKKAEPLIEEMIHHFDILCWPELTALGVSEELVGFWQKLYFEWESGGHGEDFIAQKLLERKGFAALINRFQAQPLKVAKGQMIGPVTLMWVLKKAEVPFIDRQQVFDFLWQAFTAQGFLAARVAHQFIISFDEPCAFMNKMSVTLWQDFLAAKPMDNAFGVALHTCGPANMDYLSLAWQVVHFDHCEFMQAYRKEPMKWKEELQIFFDKDQWLALGVLPSNALAEAEVSSETAAELKELIGQFKDPKVLISTSCGFGDQSLDDTIKRMSALSEFSESN